MLPDAALAEMTGHRDQMKDEVGHLSSGRETPTFEIRNARRELTGAWAEIGLLVGQVTTHRQSAEESERRESYV